MTVPPPQDKGSGLNTFLLSCLDVFLSEHKDKYLDPITKEEKSLHDALERLETYTWQLITRAELPLAAESDFADFMPGTPLATKLVTLLTYNYALEKLEFHVAYDVLERLDKLPERTVIAAVGFFYLSNCQPSATATKYLERAASLFLAGYAPEVFIMCGAVLEAALAMRIPDSLLAASELRPAYRRTGVFSLGQRMQYEETHPILSKEQRDNFWQIINWRNDSVHVQPDIGPDPSLAFITTAMVLSAILPRITGSPS